MASMIIQGIARPKYTICVEGRSTHGAPLTSGIARKAHLVQNKAHKASCDHGVYYPEVPVHPQLLDGRERRVVDTGAGIELC